VTYRNKAYLALARGKPCVCCGAQDGTTVAAHYSGLGSNFLGKGAGQKAHDFCVAWLCAGCHEDFDMYEAGNSVARSQEFLQFVLESMALVLETGEIEIVPTPRQ